MIVYLKKKNSSGTLHLVGELELVLNKWGLSSKFIIFSEKDIPAGDLICWKKLFSMKYFDTSEINFTKRKKGKTTNQIKVILKNITGGHSVKRSRNFLFNWKNHANNCYHEDQSTHIIWKKIKLVLYTALWSKIN